MTALATAGTRSSAGCEFACGGRVDDSPKGETAGRAGSGGSAAGSGGAAAGAAAITCAAGLGLCDDFEGYTEGETPGGRWQPFNTSSAGRSLVVDSTKAFSGKKAIHIKVDFEGGSVGIGTKPGDAAFAADGHTRYARFMMFQSPMTVPGELHARVLRLGTMDAPSGNNGTGYAFGFHSYPTPVAFQLESMNDNFVGTRIVPPTDKWVCWELEYAPGVIGWWQDGKTVDSPVPGGWPDLKLEMLEVGFQAFSTVKAELWLDDIVVDTKRVGCPVPP